MVEILSASDLYDSAVDPKEQAEWKRLNEQDRAEQDRLYEEFMLDEEGNSTRLIGPESIDLIHRLKPGHIYGPDHLAAVSRAKPRTDTERWPHYTGAELHERIEAPLDYLPLVGQSGYIVQGGTHVLAAYPKAGKTELVTACIREWVRSGLNVAVFGEESARVWSLRLKKGDVDGLDNLTFWPALGMTSKDMGLAVQSLVRIPDVVVIDTLRSLLGIEDENDSAEMARAVQPWVEYSQQMGCTLIVLHHTRKGGGKYGEGVSGGHGLIGAFDIVLEMNRDGDGNRRAIDVMGRLIESQKGIYEQVEILTPDGLGTGFYEMRWLGARVEVTRTDVEVRIRQVLSSVQQTTTQIHECLSDPPVPSRNTVKRALTSLAHSGLAVRQPPIDEDAEKQTVTWTSP